VKTLPPHIRPYKRTPEFTEQSIPTGLLKDHTTRSGVWGRIVVISGELGYRIAGSGEELVLSAGRPGVVEPEIPHAIAVRGPVRFWVEFLK
jgi:tellurite resistance-related uncharacterized protein